MRLISAPAQTTACFSVHANAEPAAMARVMGVFAKRGLLPTTWHGAVVGDELQMDIQVGGLNPEGTEPVARELRRLVDVRIVLTSEKRFALSA